MSRPAPRIIAEIGTSHGGDLGHAQELVHAAAEAGADTAKFQLVRADEILHPSSGIVDLPGGRIALYERFRDIERPLSFYAELIEQCRNVGIGFLCSVFGVESARALRALGADEFKVASPELNHYPLLRELAGYDRPVVLSAGVATLIDIAEAVSRFPDGASLTILHCITAYPAPESEYNLRLIPALSRLTGLPVGVSDHSTDPIAVPAVATAEGARVIEKHITLKRGSDGLDDPIALTPESFASMVQTVHDIAARSAPAEGASCDEDIEALLAVEELIGAERLAAIRGDGVKRLAESERRNYGFTNRSIHARDDMPAGTVLTEENAAILRSEKNLTPGLHPRYWELLLGRPLAREVHAGEGISWDDILPLRAGST